MRNKLLTLGGLLMATTGIALGLLIGLSAIPDSPSTMEKQPTYTASTTVPTDDNGLLGILVPNPTRSPDPHTTVDCQFGSSSITG